MLLTYLGGIALGAAVFFLSIAAERLSPDLNIPGGVFTTAIENIAALTIAWLLWRSKLKHRAWLTAIAVLICIGDFWYGLANYALGLNFANQLGCLTYVVPCLMAMALTIYFFSMKINENRKTDKLLFPVALVIFLACLGVTTVTITVPALFYKNPPLSTFLATLTVIYSLLESTVTAMAITLLFVSSRAWQQLGLFGILTMRASDLAIRYQSVRHHSNDSTSSINSLTMTIFESGWCFGICLILSAVFIWKKSEQKTRNLQFAPVHSLRGMTVGMVFFSLVAFWILLVALQGEIFSAPIASSGLLMICATFSFSIVVANLVTGRLSTFVDDLNQGRKPSFAAKHLPHEIEVLITKFNSLITETENEKNKTLKLTAQVVHDLGSPTTVLKVVRPMLEAAVKDCPSCRAEISEPLKAISLANETIQRISSSLLSKHRQSKDRHTLKSSLDDAVSLARNSFPDRVIDVEYETGEQGPIVEGLTRVISNLIKNSIEASSQNTKVLVRLTEEERGYRLSIKDQGSGIPKVVLDKFYEGEIMTTKRDGNGLGLSGMIEWVTRNGADFDIRSEEGKGTELLLFVAKSTIPRGTAHV